MSSPLTMHEGTGVKTVAQAWLQGHFDVESRLQLGQKNIPRLHRAVSVFSVSVWWSHQTTVYISDEVCYMPCTTIECRGVGMEWAMAANTFTIKNVPKNLLRMC